jgi:hypothetical protein
MLKVTNRPSGSLKQTRAVPALAPSATTPSDDDPFVIDDEDLFASSAQDVSPEREYHPLILRNCSVQNPFAEGDPVSDRRLKWKHRQIVLDWLIKIKDQVDFHEDTLLGAVVLFDRISAAYPIEKCQMQLFGAGCLWICSKIEEPSIPALFDFVYLCGRQYRAGEFRACETLILRTLKFDVASSSPIFFVRALTAGRESAGLEILCEHFTLLSIFSESFQKYSPYCAAVAAVFLADRVLGSQQRMAVTCEPSELSECVKGIAFAATELHVPGSPLFERFIRSAETAGLNFPNLIDAVSDIDETSILALCE